MDSKTYIFFSVPLSVWHGLCNIDSTNRKGECDELANQCGKLGEERREAGIKEKWRHRAARAVCGFEFPPYFRPMESGFWFDAGVAGKADLAGRPV